MARAAPPSGIRPRQIGSAADPLRTHLLSSLIRLPESDSFSSSERAAKAIRAHWRIENTSHYSRDVTMGEDRSRIRSNPGVFARLRSFAYNILKANRADTLSQDRYRAALGGLQRLLGLLVIEKR